MKKILLMAATAAMIFASCAKENETNTPAGTADLTIKISGVKAPASRLIEATGVTGELTLNDGYIFVIDPLNNVMTQSVALTIPHPAAGQTIANVPSDARVYVLGNIPSDVVVTDFETLGDVYAAASAMSNNIAYDDAAMANNDGLAKGMTVDTVDPTKAAVAISLSPLYSRLEVAQIVGGDHITSFKVAGVYVDDYFQSFTMAGKEAGNVHNQLQSKVFTGVMGENAGWTATTATGVNPDFSVATPGATDVWAFHVASKGLPRIIIHLSEVNYMVESAPGTYDVPTTISEDRYITVTGYSELTAGTDEFERGKIYKIGAGDGIKFELDDLGTTPNPTNVEMTVKVSVVDWVPVTLTPSI